MHIKKIIKPVYRKVFPGPHEIIIKELFGCDSILDLGCGPDSPIKNCNASLKVGVELFDAYLEESKNKKIHNQYIKEDVTKVCFKAKSFDAVIMIDVLEHLTKEDGYKLMKKMENWAKKKIIIFTPNGYVYQDGYDSNMLQNHKSGWTAKELESAGFKVFGMNGPKGLRGYMASIKYRPIYFWMFVSDLMQKIVYYFPNFAFQLLAVKNIK